MAIMMSRKALEEYGLVNLGNINWNLSPAILVEHALARNEGILALNGAFVATTGSHTGRSPKDKFIVANEESAAKIWWGEYNHPMSPETFEGVRRSLAAYLQGRDVYVLDAAAGADPNYRMPLQVITELAWHNLFARQLFLRTKKSDLTTKRPGFTILCVPNFRTDPRIDSTRSQTAIILDFEERLALIAGTQYAGEMKKSIFTVLNFLLPAEGVLPMHCSANVGSAGDVALFFGLSGTGKTSLSADTNRFLIGDDEHGWGDNGIFNFEGGCYAKCINLSKKYEPQIWNAIRFGAVYENVVVDPITREPDYSDDSLTENTRAAYPVDFIDNVIESGRGGHPSAVIFLSADSFGVLPPISKLTTEQAMYYFLSGYTSKLAGTEKGVTTPEATFSSCFGAAFLPLRPGEYANLLRERIEKHNVRCYLINTGWSGGPYGVGERMNINFTRAMVRAAISGELDKVEMFTDPVFGLSSPTTCPDVPSEILLPRNTWADKEAFDRQAADLAARFKKNFTQFTLPSDEVRNAGPRFNHACRYELFDRNPIRLVRKGAKRRTTPSVLTPAEIKALLSGLGLRERTLVLLAASTGLRQSELFAVKWCDIDFAQQTINVIRSIVYGVVGPCKTESSQKPVPVHATVLKTLAEWRQAAMYNKSDDWVFAGKRYHGRKLIWGQVILRKYVRPAAQRVGIQKRFGWHTFRHTYSTLLRSVGTEFKVMQELLWHSSFRSTLDVYTQAISPAKHAAQAAVLALVFSAETNATAPA